MGSWAGAAWVHAAVGWRGAVGRGVVAVGAGGGGGAASRRASASRRTVPEVGAVIENDQGVSRGDSGGVGSDVVGVEVARRGASGAVDGAVEGKWP